MGIENTLKNQKLPEFFRPLFWSYNFDSLDLEEDKKTITVNTINYGDLKHWRWIVNYYSKEGVRKTLETIPATELKKRAGRLAEILFDARLNYVPRGTH